MGWFNQQLDSFLEWSWSVEFSFPKKTHQQLGHLPQEIARACQGFMIRAYENSHWFPKRPNIKPWFLREVGWPAMVFMFFYGYLHYKLNGKQWYWQTICKPWFLRVGWLAMIFIAPSQPLNNSIGQPEMCLAVSDKVSGFPLERWNHIAKNPWSWIATWKKWTN